MDDKIRETLEKQLQLLSERSENAVDGRELVDITDAMVKLASVEDCRCLAEIPTCELVNELKHREGVETHEIGMSAEITVKADGPCVVFVVID